MAWTSPRTWVAGETVTAALMNTHVRDNLKAIGDAWTSYTVTWTGSSTNPAIGNGTKTGAYIQAGKLVIFRISITFGSTTTLGTGFYSFSLPVTSFDNKIAIGQGMAFDTSATALSSLVVFVDNSGFTTVRAKDMATDGNVTASAPFAWANGDEINLTGLYEAA